MTAAEHCPHCLKAINDAIYLVDAGNLPPVPCPILVEYEGSLRLVTRTGFISEKTREMEYQPLTAKPGPMGEVLYDNAGEPISGRLRWTYA